MQELHSKAMAAGIASARRLGGKLLDLLYPPTCGGCHRAGARFCARCAAQVTALDAGLFCPHCGQPVPDDAFCASCEHARPTLDAIRSAVRFEGPLREAVHTFKYSGRTELAEPLAALMVAFWKRNPLPADLVIPVPLHPRRERERGFNQAALLAHAFAAQVELPLRAGALERTRETAPQIGLNAQERRENVYGAFRARPGVLSGHSPLLIDDVCTTGATLEACAAALRRAGCRQVYALTLARADGQ